MIGFLTEMRSALVGVVRLVAFRTDWRKNFNISPEGVARSFSGIVLALPAFIFTVYAISFYVGQNPAQLDAGSILDRKEAALTWARYWLLFPIVAALTTLAAGMTKKFAAWVVVQNWTVFVLIHIQALIFALYPAGLADTASLSLLTQLYIVARMLAFWRVAAGALDASPAFAAALAGIPFLADWALRSIT